MTRIIKLTQDMGFKPSAEYSLDRIDNYGNYCKENCRWATKVEQRNNKRPTTEWKLQSNNTSGYRGVHFHKQHKKWEAQINIGGKQKYLGLFDSAEEAATAYAKAAATKKRRQVSP